jgi:hypothetical protein
MSDALYGLIGAVGGALVTAAAAYFGPLQIERRRLDQQRQEAESARAEMRRQAQEERQAQDAREALAVERAEKQAAIERIIHIRTSTREWSQLLARHVQDIARGRRVNLADFDVSMQQLREKTQKALDQVIQDGLWVIQSATSFGMHRQDRGGRAIDDPQHPSDLPSRGSSSLHPLQPGTSRPVSSYRQPALSPPPGDSSLTIPRSPVFHSLRTATELTREFAYEARRGNRGDIERLWVALDQVEDERAALNSALQQMIGRLHERDDPASAH